MTPSTNWAGWTLPLVFAVALVLAILVLIGTATDRVRRWWNGEK
jgi:hypothetical protein